MIPTISQKFDSNFLGPKLAHTIYSPFSKIFWSFAAFVLSKESTLEKKVLIVLILYSAIFNTRDCLFQIRHVARNGVWDMNSRIARKNLRIEKKMFKTIVYMLCS